VEEDDDQTFFTLASFLGSRVLARSSLTRRLRGSRFASLVTRISRTYRESALEGNAKGLSEIAADLVVCTGCTSFHQHTVSQFVRRITGEAGRPPKYSTIGMDTYLVRASRILRRVCASSRFRRE